MKRVNGLRSGLVLAMLLVATSTWAGRPLTVDDAGMNDKGNGHVELWFAGDNAGARAFNVAPAYAAFENVEFSALFSRDTAGRSTAYAVQANSLSRHRKKTAATLALPPGSAGSDTFRATARSQTR